MAQAISLTSKKAECDTTLSRALQSGHINFVFGSGASVPAIPVAGNIEVELDRLRDTDKAAFELKKFEFLQRLQSSTNALIKNAEHQGNAAALAEYRNFLSTIARILNERKTELLPRQVTVFSTHYDLFVEKASEDITNLRLNDGFNRNPAVSKSYSFQSEHYFDITYKTGTLFKYRFPIATVNLIKLHGSLSWDQSNGDLLYHAQARDIPNPAMPHFAAKMLEFCNDVALVLPTNLKYHETTLTRVYYDLLRIFANALEVENAVLIAFGSSFNDEHIRDIVIRALKNPTLLVVIVCYDESSLAEYQDKFNRYDNVIILHPDGGAKITFSNFNALLQSVVPKSSV
jgi:hypothetical protein